MRALRFNQNTWNWIADRLVNEEALYWKDFIEFTRFVGVSEQTIQKYRSKAYKNKVKRVYNEEKRKYKANVLNQ